MKSEAAEKADAQASAAMTRRTILTLGGVTLLDSWLS
jgi:hypothetical protein